MTNGLSNWLELWGNTNTIRGNRLLSNYHRFGYAQGIHGAGQSIARVVAVCEEFGRGHTGMSNGNFTILPALHSLWRDVALEVSSRLQEEPGVGKNLKGYFITAFRRQVRQQFLRDNRLDLRGSPQGTGAEPSSHSTRLGGGDGTEVVSEGASRSTATSIAPYTSLPDAGVYLERDRPSASHLGKASAGPDSITN